MCQERGGANIQRRWDSEDKHKVYQIFPVTPLFPHLLLFPYSTSKQSWYLNPIKSLMHLIPEGWDHPDCSLWMIPTKIFAETGPRPPLGSGWVYFLKASEDILHLCLGVLELALSPSDFFPTPRCLGGTGSLIACLPDSGHPLLCVYLRGLGRAAVGISVALCSGPPLSCISWACGNCILPIAAGVVLAPLPLLLFLRLSVLLFLLCSPLSCHPGAVSGQMLAPQCCPCSADWDAGRWIWPWME